MENLTLKDKKELLAAARNAIENKLSGERVEPQEPDSGILKEKCGAFVTITNKGNLRGCIGMTVARKPLYKTVSEMAVSAAASDPRFPPVTLDELNDIVVEISVLTPFRTISDVSEIEVGKHGLFIKRSYNQGLLLPQVPAEYKWDRKQFLEHTCMKAGLSTDAWKDDETEIQIFSAIVFGENEL